MEVMKNTVLFSGWRGYGFHIMVLPVAFLGTPVTGVARELATLNRRLAAIESLLAHPDKLDHVVDLGATTQRLYECSQILWNIEQRANFNGSLVKSVERYLEYGRTQRTLYIDPIATSLDAQKNMIESQAQDIKAFPRRIKSQQTMVCIHHSLVIQYD